LFKYEHNSDLSVSEVIGVEEKTISY